jgi:hypothetical protein
VAGQLQHLRVRVFPPVVLQVSCSPMR